MEHQGLRDHIPCILVRRKKRESQECGQILRNLAIQFIKCCLPPPPRIRLPGRICSPAMIRRLLFEDMCKRYQFSMEGILKGTFSVKNSILKGKLRGWASGEASSQFISRFRSETRVSFPLTPVPFHSSLPFNAHHAGYSQLKLRALPPD